MTYHNAQKYIMNSPNDTASSSAGNNLRKLWTLLGNPQRNIKYLRLAGSNGKTVCAEMLMSAYKNSEYTVGCLTTTLRNDLRSNILINGAPLSYEQMAEYVEKIYRIAYDLGKSASTRGNEADFILTKQEILLSAALLAFKANDCALCIIESDHKHADPTVFLPPPFSVAICGAIPCNSKDDIHMIRSYICHGIQEIVSAPQDQAAYKIISDTCAAVNCRLTIPAKSELEIKKITLGGSEFSYRGKDYKIGLCGKFQISNAIFVLELLERLSVRGYGLSDEQIGEGLQNTKIPAKFEILSIMPTIIADSTHSEVAISTVCESMSEFRNMIGSKVRLCLPEGAIVDKYVKVLSDQNYDIDKVIVAVESSADKVQKDKFIYCKKTKELIKRVLENLEKDEILLISGPSSFTLEVRYELLAQMGF
ncbi:MAG: hypothetical protein IJ011_08680 [Clostridia bacterium]|nr:hypothetical protein [Clostridia bacterium]